MILKNNQKIPLDKFINKVLYDNSKGYYMNKNPFGSKGDFITSPNISVMFSEMITIWLIAFWKKMKNPKKINIIELGPGNGEMMYQIQKTVNSFNDFKFSSKFYLYEKSPYLKRIQKNRLQGCDIKWINDFKKISKDPSIFIANEFFDALPFKQFNKRKKQWFERYVINKNNQYRFYYKKIKKSKIEKIIERKISKDHKFIEHSSLAFKKLELISGIIKRNDGGILIIDYGYNSKKMFDTLQGMRAHKKNNVLENFYQTDITHNLNFYYYKKKINSKLKKVKLTSQGNFLIKLGIMSRAEIISKKLPFSKKTDIFLRLKRLVDKNEMGFLFKVLFATKKENKFKLGF